MSEFNLFAGVLAAITTRIRRCVAYAVAVPEGKAQERTAQKGSAVRFKLI